MNFVMKAVAMTLIAKAVDRVMTVSAQRIAAHRRNKRMEAYYAARQ